MRLSLEIVCRNILWYYKMKQLERKLLTIQRSRGCRKYIIGRGSLAYQTLVIVYETYNRRHAYGKLMLWNLATCIYVERKKRITYFVLFTYYAIDLFRINTFLFQNPLAESRHGIPRSTTSRSVDRYLYVHHINSSLIYIIEFSSAITGMAPGLHIYSYCPPSSTSCCNRKYKDWRNSCMARA